MIVRWVLAISVLVFLLRYIDFSAVVSMSAQQIMGIVAVIIGLVATAWLEAARLYVLCDRQLSYQSLLRVTFTAYFLTNFTPSSFGGDGYKVYALSERKSISAATALVLIERLLGLGVLLLVSLLAALVMGGEWVDDYLAYSSQATSTLPAGNLLQWLVPITLSVIACFLLWLRNAISRVLSEFFQALSNLSFRIITSFIAYAFCFHLCRALLLGATLFILGAQLEFSQAWIVLTFAAIASIIPLSPGGLGIREAAFVMAMLPFGVDAPLALLAGLIFRLGNIAQAVIGVFVSSPQRL